MLHIVQYVCSLWQVRVLFYFSNIYLKIIWTKKERLLGKR